MAGVNSDQADDGVHFVSWTGDTCPFPTWLTPCTSADVIANNAAGQEMIIRLNRPGSWPGELTVNVKDPDGNVFDWDPSTSRGGAAGEESHNSGNPSPLIMDKVGTYIFNLEDSYGDGANGGGFEIIQAAAGAWAGTTNNNPVQYWIPYNHGLTSVEPTSCYALTGSHWPCGYASVAYGDKATPIQQIVY